MSSLRFGDFSLDSGSRQLLRDGRAVHLSRRAFDALCILAERRPSAVPKEELHARLWPDTFVVDANLSVLIAEIRRALGDDPQAPSFIRTVHRVGYAFCAETPDDHAPEGRAAPLWLVCRDRALPLAQGDNFIGRDPDCAIWLDVAGVSRRHARIRVSGDTATLEDLGSKNGTSVAGMPLSGPHRLADGDRLVLGPVEAEFRQGPVSRPTETIRLSGEERGR